MAIYMKYGSIKGRVTTEGFKDWIELNSFQWGASRHIGTAARGSTTREHSEPNLSEVAVTKLSDVASPKLFLDAVANCPARIWPGLRPARRPSRVVTLAPRRAAHRRDAGATR